MNPSPEKKVLILILNWNKKEFILKLLNQIQNIEYINYKCLVVDNNSDDNSVAEIKSKFPEIQVLENMENLGGTGGFNSGLEYVLNNILCDYIWLIDNDAEIERNTLSSLVEVMEKDRDIGIAGSRILDINDKETTIELGSFVKWDTIGVRPNLRNRRLDKFDYEYIETDYVAICSALVRVEALQKVGIMDERHFIFWDDMDWGLQFGKNNYKVVAVPGSIAYHPSFTERKRGITTDYYYGLRNPLLVYSKHAKPFLRFKIFSIFFLNYSMFLVLLVLDKRWNQLKYASTAILDFVNNNWGKCGLELSSQSDNSCLNLSEQKLEKVLVIFDSYSDDGLKILNDIKKYNKKSRVYALIDNDRERLYKNHFDEIISVEADKRRTNILYNFEIFIKLLKLKFDLSVGSNTNPFGYATRNYCIYNSGSFEKTDIKKINLYKVIISCLFGTVLSIIITPVVFISSLKYSRNSA